MPIFPVYVVVEEEKNMQFILDADPIAMGKRDEGVAEQFLRRYLKVETRHRLFQAGFRGTVMRANKGRCAVCNLQHGQLLDAAHIIPDRDEDRIASVVDGGALQDSSCGVQCRHSGHSAGPGGPDTVRTVARSRRPDASARTPGDALEASLSTEYES